MHRIQVRTQAALVLALAVVLTLGACDLADSPEVDTSASPGADDGVESAAEQTPAEVATEEPGDDAPDTDDEAAGRDAADEDGTSDDGDVVEVELTEFAYEPDTIELTAGEPTVVRFTNVGEIEHEAMLGTAHMQQEFAATDGHGDHGDGGDEGGHHGDVEAVTVAPGETAELEVLIEEPGTWYLGCHLEGHYDAGMEAEVHVTR